MSPARLRHSSTPTEGSGPVPATAPPGTGSRDLPPRERMVLAAAKLFRVQGVSGTGLREVVEKADAPRGSLQHYFPGGKEQLVIDALQYAGDFAGRRTRHHLERLADPTPGDLFAALVGEWRDLYLRDGFAEGCPLAAAAADTAATSPAIRAALGASFDRWQQPLEEALGSLGVPRERTSGLATLMIVGLEGALILARSRADAATIDTVIDELRPVLDGAVARQRRRRGYRGAGVRDTVTARGSNRHPS
jgi:AcrR family transcriptional regulator